jgi:uncharacterized protein YjbI with pentapeptide repeats
MRAVLSRLHLTGSRQALRARGVWLGDRIRAVWQAVCRGAERLGRAIRRHAVAAVVAVLLLLGIAGLTWYMKPPEYVKPGDVYDYVSDIATILGGIALVIGLWRYVAGEGDRRKAKQYQAWQVINSAQDKEASGGRIEALRDLAADRVSLEGVNLQGARLPSLKLPVRTDLTGANLQGAYLRAVQLKKPAQLKRANLYCAQLQRADLNSAHLEEANLSDAHLEEAELWGAQLKGANLLRAHLKGADLRKAQLEAIKHWESIADVKLANIYGIRDAPARFQEWALENGAVEIEDWDEWQEHKKRAAAGHCDNNEDRMTAKEQLHRLIDTLPERQLDTAVAVLEALAAAADPSVRAHAAAPVEDEPETPAEAATAAEARMDTAAGRAKSLEQVQREMGLS